MKITYAIWDVTDKIENSALRSRISDTDWVLTVRFPGIRSGKDPQELIRTASIDSTHIVLFMSGNVIIDQNRLINGIERLCSIGDFMIAGHVIHHAGAYPHLHQQMIIVDLMKYRMLKSPDIGTPTRTLMMLRSPKRSIEDFHGGYTPHWIGQGRIDERFSNFGWGWNLIRVSMENGWKVRNLPINIRTTRRFLYWWRSSDDFSKCLESINFNSVVEISDQLDVVQQEHIRWLMDDGNKVVFVFNTEPIEQYPIPKRKRFIGPAAGFKLFCLWNMAGHPDSTIVHFDHNPRSLTFMKMLIDEWDGRDLHSFFMRKHANTIPSGFNISRKSVSSTIDAFSNNMSMIHSIVDDFESTWNQYRRLKHVFVELDIVSNPTNITELLSGDDVIWYSNIFNYVRSVYKHGLEDLSRRHNTFINAICEISPNAMCIGIKPPNQQIFSYASCIT